MALILRCVTSGVEGFVAERAIKWPFPHIVKSEEYVSAFKNEARLAAQLQHSNIAQIYELKSKGDDFYIVLEYIPGKDIRTILNQCQATGQPMPLAQACYIIGQTCEGLEYIHNIKDRHGRSMDIVHRDVNPSNVIISYDGNVKLIDFGIAQCRGAIVLPPAEHLDAKSSYIAPEQAPGSVVDRRADVFSAGVMLRELVNNHCLFGPQTSSGATRKQAISSAAPSRAGLAKLEQIMNRSIAHDPEDRYQSAAQLRDALYGFLFDEGLFCSRKVLAEWMQTHFAKDIVREQEKAHHAQEIAAGRRPPPPPTLIYPPSSPGKTRS